MRSHSPLVVPVDLWDHEKARRALAARDLAAVIKHFRQYTGASQTTVGSLTGLAQSDVSAIERGLRQVQSVDVLTRIAAGLAIPFSLLGLADKTGSADHPARRNAPVPQMTAAKVTEAELEDDVRRRELMTGALGLSAGLIAGTGSDAAAAEPAAQNPAAAMERALFEPVTGRPTSLSDLADGLARARGMFSSARYAALGGALPPLIATAEATRDAATGRTRERAQAAVARAYVLATELAVKQHSEAAWATADRALIAARASGDPRPLSDAARVLAITMRRAGRSSAAVDFLARTATSLVAEKGRPQADTLAARVCLLMTAAYTAASGGRRSTALDLLQEAEETAGRIPISRSGKPAGLFTISASPAEVSMYRISSLTVLGTPDDAVPYVHRVDPTQLANTERVARYLTDTARMWHQLGDGRRTFSALRAIERTAPEEVQRPAIRTLTADLLYTPGSLPGLREFAVRTGAVAA
ncbi:helix-turn-helix domain-containing protein [Streptomyces johnsoniae]|uniref:Helix-turn-helix domain-containing protein n=1 Tax=Streptomyces johnsoniae TaxID=3075532 RepID=A0ABU2S9N6_9ACTN|nr:helix-turn-helix domain-containing protein [Streptomyces sp. DSM 41886]MDT0445627.1 helix-turn-helix domain-containing protein [Streptomyces sp. DSM 41886]